MWHRAPGEQTQVFTISHIFSINYLAWPKAPSIQRHPYHAVDSKALQVIAQEQVQGQYPKLAELTLYCKIIILAH